MNLFAHIAQFLGEHQFYLGMNILHAVFDDKLAFLGDGVDILQFCEELGKLILFQKSDAFEHGDVCHTAKHVVFGEIEVELTVATYGESFDFLVYFKVLFPKFMCHNFFIFNPGKESSPGRRQFSRCLPAMASSPYP